MNHHHLHLDLDVPHPLSLSLSFSQLQLQLELDLDLDLELELELAIKGWSDVLPLAVRLLRLLLRLVCRRVRIFQTTIVSNHQQHQQQ